MSDSQKLKTNMVKRTERGWAGHYICADQCMFKRHTLLEFKGINIIVSTVGQQFRTNNHKPVMVGSGRFYETLVFKAKYSDSTPKMLIANVNEQIEFDSNWMIENPHKHLEANQMHEDVVSEIMYKMINEPKELESLPF